MNTIKYLTVATILSSLFACVPARKFEELKAKYEKCETEKAALSSSNETSLNEINELNTKIEEANKDIAKLKKDTFQTKKEYNSLKKVNDDLNQTYDMLLQRNRELLAGNVDETNRLMKAHQINQEELQKREDDLKRLEAEFKKKQADYAEAQQNLKEKAKRVEELESLINRKDSISKALKTKVSKALLGFENKGLTVEQKNGKVYVSLEEELLFASGSREIGVKGKEALVKLAKILEEQKDINIAIEGHTDDVPYKGAGAIKDNWDLSVLRATTVVRILTQNSSIDPVRLTPSGKGPFLPLVDANTKEARRKNRRTEIVLTPKLDELLKLLGE